MDMIQKCMSRFVRNQKTLKKMKTTLIPVLFLFVYFLSGCSHQPAIYSEIVGDGEDQIEIVVVEGTPYEMGFLLGKSGRLPIAAF